MNPAETFLVSALHGKGESARHTSAVVKGAKTPQAALSAYLRRHPQNAPITVVSLDDMKRSVGIVERAAAGQVDAGVDFIDLV